MLFERLPGIQARLHAYEEKTREGGIMWRMPAPVPESRRSRLNDYFFSWGRFDPDSDGPNSASLGVFVQNPNRKPNLYDPSGYMLIQAPFGTLEDLVVIFKTHIEEMDMGMVAGGIRVIKGVVPELPWQKEEAELFTYEVNREISRLFFLAMEAAQITALLNTKLELERLDDLPRPD